MGELATVDAVAGHLDQVAPRGCVEMIMEGVHRLPGPETKPSEDLLFPCSSSQQRCWFIHALSPGGSVLNVALRWEITGRFAASTIEQAFQTIINWHEILRTRFVEKDGESVQEVARALDFHLGVAVRFTDTGRYFVSEASVYRLLKAHDLIASPAFIVMKAVDEFKEKTTAPNQLWQTDFTYLKVIGWGWFYLSTVLDDFSRYIIAWKLC